MNGGQRALQPVHNAPTANINSQLCTCASVHAFKSCNQQVVHDSANEIDERDHLVQIEPLQPCKRKCLALAYSEQRGRLF